MNDDHAAPPHQPALVEQLIKADDERRRLRKSGRRDLSTIELSEQLTPAQRDELSRMLECADELERLAAFEAGENSWTTPVLDEDSFPADAGEFAATEDHKIGNYRILGLIADGGFGAVLLAIDERDDRQVALKVPRPDIRLTRRLQERFLTEGRAAATLSHPNIVAVYETLSQPVPAIVYEYCDGGTLSQAAKRINDEQTAIRMVLLLAEALQHAHTRGILHRDVKPGNVLLVRCEDSHNEQAVEVDGEWWIPKLGDFGLAKVLDDSAHQTQTGVVMGTPQFMAPEQAAGRVSELGTHTDVFSLGAIFYWLLAGRPPFDGNGTLQTLRMVETAEPPPLRWLRRSLSAKTEAVCMKCLRKPIDARYPSAAALADDLRHLLLGEPVSVRPPGVVERLQQWRRRNPALAVFAIMFPLAACLGLLIQWNNNRSLQNYVERLDSVNQNLVSTTQLAESARSMADRERSRYAQLFYAADLQLAQRAFESGDVKTYTEALARHIPDSGSPLDLRGVEWQALWEMGHPPHTPIDQFPSAVYCVNLSRDGRSLLACGADATVRVYETENWQRVAMLQTGQQEVNYAAFSSDGTRIASAGDDGTILLWDWRQEEQTGRIAAYDDLVYCVQFYDNDAKLASCARNEVIRLWDARSGAPLGELLGQGDPHRVEQLDASEDGQWLASASFDGIRRVWRLDDQKRFQSYPSVDGQRISSVGLFRRDGQEWVVSGTLRVGSRAECSVILEALGGEDQRVLPIHFDGIQAVTADRQGELAAAGDGGGCISLIDVNAAIRGKQWWYPETIRKSWVGHTGRVFGLALADEGRTVISAGEDGKLTRWHVDQIAGRTSLSALEGRNRWMHGAVSPQQAVYLVDTDSKLQRWNPHTNRLDAIVGEQSGKAIRIDAREDRVVGSLAVADDRVFGRHLSGPVCCWKVEGTRARREWSANIGDDPQDPTPDIYAVALSSDGRQLAVCRRGHPVHNVVLDADTGEILQKIPVPGGISVGCRAIAFDATGERLAYGSESDVIVRNLQTDTQVQLHGHSAEIRQVCFVPGTNLLLSGANDRTICLWDLSSGRLNRQLTGHRAAIECLGMHPEGDRLLSSDDLGWVRIWSLEDGMLLAELPPQSRQTWYIACGESLMGIADGQTVFQQQLRSPQQ